ncbi:MAG TPA: YdcF family protein [Lysobacter sp.]
MWLLSPLVWLMFACALLALGGCLTRLRRPVVVAGTVLALVAIAGMTPLVGNALVGRLEAPGPRAAACDGPAQPAVAAVLAGGIDARVQHPDDFTAMGITSRRRMEQAVAWWRAAPGRRLVVSGGPGPGAGVATAHLMAVYARQLGVPDDALTVESRSLTTWLNARELAAMRPAVPRRIVLVTSAMHMPRARYAMEWAGFEVCELPADSRLLPFGLPGFVIPGTSALVKTEAALHEAVGALYYRWAAYRQRDRRPG